MNLKKGGGKKDQPYDVRNGRYVNKNVKEEDLYPNEPLLTEYDGKLWLLNHPGKKAPIPIYHDDKKNKDYLIWWIKTYVTDLLVAPKHSITDRKVYSYLFDERSNNDKSKFLKLLGFDKSNGEELKRQLLERTLFNKYISLKPKDTGINISFITYLTNPITNKTYKIESVWSIRTRDDLKFVTLYSYKGKKGEK